MSSTSRRQRGYMRVNQLTSLRFVLYKIFSLVSACAAGALPFVQRDKRKQKHALCHRSERSHNHRQSLFELIFILLFLLTFSVGFGRCLSVIVSVSPLCFSGALFPTALFKTASLCLFATFFFHLASSRLSRFAVTTLYRPLFRQSIAAL